MMVYRPPTRHAYAPIKVALLSGLSDPTTCALTKAQHRFFDSLNVPEAWKVRLNFPYLAHCNFAKPSPPIWSASLQNLRQFLLASQLKYRTGAQRHWQALRQSCEHLVVVALSCGYEILRQCVTSSNAIPPSHVVALGPVGWKLAPFSCTLVQGGGDFLSKLFFRTSDVALPGVGHMGYVENSRVIQVTNEVLNRYATLGEANTGLQLQIGP